MAIHESSADSQTTTEEGDGGDTPAQGDISNQMQKLRISPSHTPSSTSTLTANTGATLVHSPNSYPLPPPDSHLTGVKQPGLTRDALQKLNSVPLSNVSSSSSDKQKGQQQLASARQTPSPIHTPSPSATSPTDSYWEGASAPPSRGPSRPPSQPASRAPSMSAGVSGGKIVPPSVALPTAPQSAGLPGGRERRASRASDYLPTTPGRASKPASVHSDKGDGGSHKFNLKDLLASGPKLNRKSSQRSTSSRRSDSDAGEGNGRAKSTAGDSAVSLTQKYGVCQKVAIGKGATSVVRLAHKWDRTEEKLYAIKVCFDPYHQRPFHSMDPLY